MGPEATASDSKAEEQQQDNEDSDDVAEGAEGEFEVESILDGRLVRQTKRRKAKQTLQQQLEMSDDPQNYEFLAK